MKRESFEYKGLTFVPIRNLTEKEGEFNQLSKQISDSNITPDGWNVREFYDVAIQNNAYVDLFKVDETIILPGERYLFSYNRQ